MTDDYGDFWSATPELATIYQWARARYAAPWAVFGQVLARVAASTGPHVQLPAVIGGRASLNLMAVFVARSGGGKGISDRVARLAWPASIVEVQPGSGEGLSELFREPREGENRERVTRAIVTAAEVDSLAALASRQGSSLIAQLRCLVMGEAIGQQNAQSATTRRVPEHSYRACLSIGAQPLHCGVLLNDSSGGLPQRGLWFLTTDPTMPADAPADPEPLNVRLPVWATLAPANNVVALGRDRDRQHPDGVVEIIYEPAEIKRAVVAAHLARQRGEGDALDGHWMLTRCKVAALLAILQHRRVVNASDWELSGVVMAKSDATRAWVISEETAASRAKSRERAIARASADEEYDSRLLEGVKRSIVRALERDGEQAGNVLRSRMGKRDRRDMFDQAIALLEHEGSVMSIAVDRGSRYRLSKVQGEPSVQGRSSQVNRGEPKVQGEPAAQEIEAENPRSLNSAPEPVAPIPDPTKTPEPPVKPPRPTTCTVCYVTLPSSATRPVCDECDGAPVRPHGPRRSTLPLTAHVAAERLPGARNAARAAK